jgi:hypothetical protein
MGSGRMIGGALEWSDFVDDDHGANGTPVAAQPSDLAPTIGTYVYPTAAAHGNGADIFRIGVGVHRGSSYWRIDWNTLADPKVPVAEFALDTDHDAATGTSAWPANAGVTSPGSDRFLVVSSRGAWLYDARGHARSVRALGGAVGVDRASRSFVVRIPTHALPLRRTWRLRTASGVANGKGTGFATVPPGDGNRGGEPNVYNVGFRTRRQEPGQITPPTGAAGVISPTPYDDYTQAEDAGTMTYDHGRLGNFWNEGAQAFALAGGSIAKFSTTVSWPHLRAHRRTRQASPTGYSVRYYVAHRNNLGQGVRTGANDVTPVYLGLVQPYSVYVPTNYHRGHPLPVTWVLHSLGVNYNQYAALSPKFLQQLCQARDSICATTGDRGPGGWYFDDGEVDFWSVWHALAHSYSLDPHGTVLSGYSMGGYAAYKLGLEYPDVFAKSVALAGPPMCGLRLYGSVSSPDGPGNCTTAGDTTPLVGNARWLPYQMADGNADEEVPYSSVVQQINAFRSDGERFAFQSYPGEDHLVFAVQDGFHSVAKQVGHPRLARNPGSFSYSFYPQLRDRRRGIGPTRDYWVSGLRARVVKHGTLARVVAASGERPVRSVTTHVSDFPVADTKDASPSNETTETWTEGARPAKHPTLRLRLVDIRSLRIDPAAAGIAHRTVRVAVTTDGPTTLRVGRVVKHLGKGVSTFRLSRSAS